MMAEVNRRNIYSIG